MHLFPQHSVLHSREWQEHVNRLLCEHYAVLGETYEPITDRTNGDAGLEGVSCKGHAYQSYGPLPDQPIKTVKEAQIAKITEDLAKLEKFASFWKNYLQGKQLTKWTLVVPLVPDKAVQSHAKRKARELRNKSSKTFLSTSFDGFVMTENEFPVALQRLVNSGATRIALPHEPVTDGEIAQHSTAKPQFIQNLERKLGALLESPSVAAEAKEVLLKHYIRAENMLARMSAQTPQIHIRTLNRRSDYGEQLRTKHLFDRSPASQRFDATRQEFLEELRRAMPGFDERTIEELCWGTVSLWLQNCDLDFRGGKDVKD